MGEKFCLYRKTTCSVFLQWHWQAFTTTELFLGAPIAFATPSKKIPEASDGRGHPAVAPHQLWFTTAFMTKFTSLNNAFTALQCLQLVSDAQHSQCPQDVTDKGDTTVSSPTSPHSQGCKANWWLPWAHCPQCSPRGAWPSSACSLSAGAPGSSVPSSPHRYHTTAISFLSQRTLLWWQWREGWNPSPVWLPVLTRDSFYKSQTGYPFRGSCKAGFNSHHREYTKALVCSAALGFFWWLCEHADQQLTLPPDDRTHSAIVSIPHFTSHPASAAPPGGDGSNQPPTVAHHRRSGALWHDWYQSSGVTAQLSLIPAAPAIPPLGEALPSVNRVTAALRGQRKAREKEQRHPKDSGWTNPHGELSPPQMLDKSFHIRSTYT